MANTLTSLALIKAFSDTSRSYRDVFVPLVAETIRRSSAEVVSVGAVQRDMRTLFEIEIPQHALIAILTRVRRAGYVRQRDGAYYRVPKALSSLDFRDTQQMVIRQHEELVEAIRSHAVRVFKLSLTVSDAEDALLSFLDQYAIDIVKASYASSAIPTPRSPHRSARLIVGDYLYRCAMDHSSHFEFFETVAKGLMLANSVFLPDPGKLQKKFQNTSLYLDTPILVYALGYAGADRQAPIDEMLTLCYELGAELRCFRHTLEEARGVLDACREKIGSGHLSQAYGPSIEYFLSKGSTASDIELHVVMIEQDLRAKRIQVEAKPSYEPVRHNVDEIALEQRLEEAIGYRRDRARLRDVDSVAAIMRQRRGLQSSLVEDSGALFVTTNRPLVTVARDFFWDARSPTAVPPCVTDMTLTNILWLKKPLSVPDLPAKRIIADTYAAVQPDDELWHHLMIEAEKLRERGEITSEEVLLMRYGAEAKQIILERTADEDEVFTAGSVREILEIVRERIRQDLEQKIKDSNLVNEELARQLAEREQEQRQREQRHSAQGMSVGTAVSRICAGVFFLVFVSGGTLSLFRLAHNPVLRFVVAGLQFAVVVFGAANWTFGASVKSFLRRIETGVQSAYVRLLK
jgi:hypothetical protein